MRSVEHGIPIRPRISFVYLFDVALKNSPNSTFYLTDDSKFTAKT